MLHVVVIIISGMYIVMLAANLYVAARGVGASSVAWNFIIMLEVLVFVVALFS